MKWKPPIHCLLLILIVSTAAAAENDRGMYGGDPSRNMASDAKGLPENWDPSAGTNIKWTATLGTETYGGPVLAGGMLFVGTNNEGLRNPKMEGDRGVVMAFSASNGEFLWQATHKKLTQGRDLDWPLQGVCSTPLVEGDRLYYVNNRCELVCLDTQGFRDGQNDGDSSEEHTGPHDADLVWKIDMMGQLKVLPHNMSLGSPVSAGNLLFAGTSNGIDGHHLKVPSPGAPSFLAVDKRSGKVVWQDNSPGDSIMDGQWSNPAYGTVGGSPQVVFAGGDGWVYAFGPQDGKLIWKFNANRQAGSIDPGERLNNIIATPVIHQDRVYIGLGNDPEAGDGPGRLWVIDATKRGDITEKGVVWSRGGEDYRLTLSTVAIQDGLLYASDLSGFLYCLDAATGQHHWTYDAFAAIWGSPFVADGKVYLADEDGDVAVLKAGTKLEEIAEINMGNSILTTPTAQDGVLYVATREKLFAIGK